MSPDLNKSIAPQQQSESKPVLWLTALAAACTAVVGILATAGLPAWITLVVAGLGVVATAVAGVLTKSQVTPWEDVAAKVTPDGQTIAGPAADVDTGSPATVTAGSGVEGL